MFPRKRELPLPSNYRLGGVSTGTACVLAGVVATGVVVTGVVVAACV